MARFHSFISVLMVAGWIIWLLCYSYSAYGKDSVPTQEDKIRLGEIKYGEGDLATALKIFTEVAQTADEENNTRIGCLAHYDLGVIYFSLFSNGEAIQNFQKAYDICMHNKLGPSREAEILSGMSGVFFKLGNYAKAKATVKKALSISENNKDSAMLYTLAADMALLCNKTTEFDSVNHWINFAKRYSAAGNNEIHLLEIAAETAILQKDYTRAENTCNEILTHPAIKKDSRALAYTYLLKIAGEENRWEEAADYEEKASNEVGMGMKVYFFEVASDVHTRKGEYRKALELKDSMIFYKDSLERANNRQLIENGNIKFEVMKYQLEAEKMLESQKSRTLIWISIAAAFLFLLIICIMLWRQQQHRHRTQQEMLALQLEKEHKEKELVEERMHESELISQHRHEMLQKEIERQNAQMQANAMFVSSRNQLIENLLKYIDNIDNDAAIPEIRSLRKHLGRMLGKDSKEHEEFMMNVEAADPELSRKLLAAHPDLLQSDIKFLGYIKMNMSMKEIAAIMNINPDSCKRRKIRITKKLGLESSSDLYAYLLSL